MRKIVVALVLGLSAVCISAQTRARKTLDIYVVDVEGGNATLFVSRPARPCSSTLAMAAQPRSGTRAASWPPSRMPASYRSTI